jgi:uncharacterized protein
MLHLQEMAKFGQQAQVVTLKERLPDYVAPCQLNARYNVEARDKYYLIHLKTTGELDITCQRCMQEFRVPYENQTVLAVCQTDEKAEQMLELYETIVSSNGKVDLVELIIDELHLYAPNVHLEINDCDSKINEILKGCVDD